MITQQTVFVNIKNRAHYELNDCLNYYFTSNHSEAFYLDENDRRFFVHNLGDIKYPADKYRDEFEPWFNTVGASAIRHYLEFEVDLKKPIVGGNPTSTEPRPFNPGAAAPQTAARAVMIVNNRNEAEEWVDELLRAPGNVLHGMPWTLATGPELYQLFRKSHAQTRIPYKTFCTKLRARLKPVYGDNEIIFDADTKMKVYPIRNAEKWLERTSMTDILLAYNEESHGCE
jgi:hypothetical protein